MSFNPGNLEEFLRGMLISDGKKTDSVFSFHSVEAAKLLLTPEDAPAFPPDPVPTLPKRFNGSGMLSRKLMKVHNSQFNEETKPPPPPKTAPAPFRRPVPTPSAKQRVVRCIWPRDPNGPVMADLPSGKVAENNQRVWGATLDDFYYVRPFPKASSVTTRMCGSRLAAWMKEIGEVEHAKEEIKRAEAEEHPREVFPCDIGRLLDDKDSGIPTWRPLEQLVVAYMENDEENVAPTRPQNHPDKTVYVFQQRIPYHLLPEKLVVHDDGGTLRALNNDYPRPPKKSHVYRLYVSSHVKQDIVRQRAAVQKEHVAAHSKGGMLFVPSSLETPIVSPSCCTCPGSGAIFAKFSKKPALPLSTPEAHLYLSPERIVGRGHHSVVYSAEWEVPRTWLPSFQPRVCEQCACRVLLEKFKKDMPEVEVDETQYIGNQISIFVMEAARRSGGVGSRCESDVGKIETGCEGPVREIDIDVRWQGPGTYCEHERRRSNKTTFRTLVTAKLSFECDEHLEQEAKNYQQFPAHFFQHWSGYNIVAPLHDPTPIGAVVPQFYGYYVPERVYDDDGGYLSPILLLEDCGTPIDIDTLDIDDRQECASLLFRFHHEGWLHGSVFPRNIVVQHGDVEDWPECRRHSDRRFRLIDFGRSEKGDTVTESWKAQQLLKVGNCERI
ncbi:uncharacterized protein BT62DRAFT_1079395 [Guyanagaster necrorhizus]|uniref:Protein kinase domain-containing protein n=1 Tax=Guyanagaster necrorhizus TaxID=856835 RepID=A0A9P7VLU2_9AGAR|nr:uncharacterized protein BT62DRAFT_1079395 [Guyanagaster necrorhizus MCA 3950]KAG7442274.1 hypothetical protein BT62DRAFT_1079395 [Guyanagaster necrorhizus MCA 3950]